MNKYNFIKIKNSHNTNDEKVEQLQKIKEIFPKNFFTINFNYCKIEQLFPWEIILTVQKIKKKIFF